MSQTGETEEVVQRSETRHGSQTKAQSVGRKRKTPSNPRSDGSPGPSRDKKRRRSGVELPSSSSPSQDGSANKDLVPQTCEASAGFSCSSVRSKVSPGPSKAETKKVDVPSSSSSSEEDQSADPVDSDSKESTSSSVSIRSDMSMPDYENFRKLKPRPRPIKCRELARRPSALITSKFKGGGPAPSSSGTSTVTPPVAPQSEEGAPAEFKVPMRPSSPKGSSAVSSKGDGPEGPRSAK